MDAHRLMYSAVLMSPLPHCHVNHIHVVPKETQDFNGVGHTGMSAGLLTVKMHALTPDKQSSIFKPHALQRNVTPPLLSPNTHRPQCYTQAHVKRSRRI